MRALLAVFVVTIGMQFSLDAAAQRPRGQLVRGFPPGLPEARLAKSNAEELKLNEETLAALEVLTTEGEAEEERLRALTVKVHTALGRLVDTQRPEQAELAVIAEGVATAARDTVSFRMQTSMRVRALLTDEQLTQFMQLRKEKFNNRRANRRGSRRKPVSEAESKVEKADDGTSPAADD
jgi:hypothetical protein